MSILPGSEKLKCSVLETRWSSFYGFNPAQGKTYPFTLISSPLSKTAHGESLGSLGGDFVIPL
jgi:hypothetical protein